MRTSGEWYRAYETHKSPETGLHMPSAPRVYHAWHGVRRPVCGTLLPCEYTTTPWAHLLTDDVSCPECTALAYGDAN